MLCIFNLNWCLHAFLKYSFLIKQSQIYKQLTIFGGTAKEQSYSKHKTNYLNEEFIEAFFTLIKKRNKWKLQATSQFWYFCLTFLLKIYQKQLLRGVLLNRCCLRKHVYERLLINCRKQLANLFKISAKTLRNACTVYEFIL